MLYGVLRIGKCHIDRLTLRYKDVLEDDLKNVAINPKVVDWERSTIKKIGNQPRKTR